MTSGGAICDDDGVETVRDVDHEGEVRASMCAIWYLGVARVVDG